MIIAGVDPGFSGAIAIISNKGNIPIAFNVPLIKGVKGKKDEINEVELRKILSSTYDGESINHVFIESVHSMPKQGVSSMFRFGMSWGLVRGICGGLQIPYTLIPSQVWKKAIMGDVVKSGDKVKDKYLSVVKVEELFPDVSLPLKKDHGKADAILLAEYGRRLHERN